MDPSPEYKPLSELISALTDEQRQKILAACNFAGVFKNITQYDLDLVAITSQIKVEQDKYFDSIGFKVEELMQKWVS